VLANDEREVKCHNLAREVKQLRRKLRNLERLEEEQLNEPIQEIPDDHLLFYDAYSKLQKERSDFKNVSSNNVLKDLVRLIAKGKIAPGS
jgi:hypothetical protein